MRKLIGKYYVPKGDIRRVNRTPKRSSDKPKKKRSFDKFKFWNRKGSIDNVLSTPVGSSIYGEQQSAYGGGKRKRRKTKRKPKRTRRTKRRSRRSRR